MPAASTLKHHKYRRTLQQVLDQISERVKENPALLTQPLKVTSEALGEGRLVLDVTVVGTGIMLTTKPAKTYLGRQLAPVTEIKIEDQERARRKAKVVVCVEPKTLRSHLTRGKEYRVKAYRCLLGQGEQYSIVSDNGKERWFSVFMFNAVS